jgi:hypothetical protein
MCLGEPLVHIQSLFSRPSRHSKQLPLFITLKLFPVGKPPVR